MPSIKDYVQGYGRQNVAYDGTYLDGDTEFDPAVTFGADPVELAYEEEAWNLQGKRIVAPVDNGA
jgi:hypothetical protein